VNKTTTHKAVLLRIHIKHISAENQQPPSHMIYKTFNTTQTLQHSQHTYQHQNTVANICVFHAIADEEYTVDAVDHDTIHKRTAAIVYIVSKNRL
jgi:hypothetical protein